MDAHVTVTRNDPNDVKVRQVIVQLDGEPFATLLYGESATKPVPPGNHRLKVDNTWVWKTEEFTIGAGEQRNYRVINRAGRFTWWLVGLLGAGPMYVTVVKES